MSAINIAKPAYAMATADGKSAEITMYGEVVETRPVDWWTGELVEGDYICQDEFLEDLKALEGVSDLTIRMNSLGGDAIVGIVIHNRLRELARDGVSLTCIVDGIAASAGSIVMSAADIVKVNPSSLVMIHKCWTFLFGAYDSDDVVRAKAFLDSYDKAAISIYQRKTKLSETKLRHMMGETTYMTGEEAVSYGFADELLEGSEPLEIAASADGRFLFAKGHCMRLNAGAFAPDSIPTVESVVKAPGSIPTIDPGPVPDEIKIPAAAAADNKGGSRMTLEELKAAHADLVEQIRAEATADSEALASAAVEAERSRLAAIDEVAGLFSPDEVLAAKYGDSKRTAEEMVMDAAKRSVAQGKNFLRSLEADATASGTSEVEAAGVSDQADDLSAAKADAKAAAREFLKKRGVK